MIYGRDYAFPCSSRKYKILAILVIISVRVAVVILDGEQIKFLFKWLNRFRQGYFKISKILVLIFTLVALSIIMHVLLGDNIN